MDAVAAIRTIGANRFYLPDAVPDEVVFDAVAATTRRVTVRGRVALTRNGNGNWTIFAYDAGRSAKTPKGGAQTGEDS